MSDEREPDDALVDELRMVVAAADPVPPNVLDAARSTFTWRTIDAELAELTVDTVLDSGALAGVRGAHGPRLLTFEVPSLTVELEVAEVGERRRLVGQLVPPQRADVEVRHALGALPVAADDLGRFTVDGLPGGPVSLRCILAGGAVVETSWTSM